VITPELLRAATGCTDDRAALFAQPLNDACANYGIDTPVRLAAFLAQVGHESGSLRYVRELTDGSAYEGRIGLGNAQPGDGVRYRGRGLIQITGRDNYRQAAHRMHPLGAPDFEAQPEALEQPRWAAWSAADWWASRDLNALADAGAFDAITMRINGGQNGAEDRRSRWERAKQALAASAQAPAAAKPVDPARAQTEWDLNNPPAPAPAEEPTAMPTVSQVLDSPLTRFALAAVNPLLGAVPELVHLFTDKATGQTVPERNTAAGLKMVQVAQAALQAAGHDIPNAQAVAETVAASPEARSVVREALMGAYYDIAVSEAGGGGIEGARKADVAVAQAGDMLHSPSFWIALTLLPLVYLIVGSLIGVVGSATWSDDVRAGLAGSLISAIVGGLVGYYYGQTTSRNRSAAP